MDVLTNQSWYLKLKPFHLYGYIDNFLTPDQCRQVIEYGKKQSIVEGVVRDKTVHTKLRNNTNSYFNSADKEIEWLYRRATDGIESINNLYGFDLDYIEILQFTIYDRVGDFYSSHMDLMPDHVHYRKLSFSVQLSDPNDYEGSNLELMNGEEYVPMERIQGKAVFFPSFVPHRVTELKKGSRYSLVGWVCGPSWK